MDKKENKKLKKNLKTFQKFKIKKNRNFLKKKQMIKFLIL